MTQKYKQALTQHLAEMTARQTATNNKVKELQAVALAIQSERDHLLMTIQGLDDGEEREPDKQDRRCGGCEYIREGTDSEGRLNHRCVVDRGAGIHPWVCEDKEGCDKWEVMR